MLKRLFFNIVQRAMALLTSVSALTGGAVRDEAARNLCNLPKVAMLSPAGARIEPTTNQSQGRHLIHSATTLPLPTYKTIKTRKSNLKDVSSVCL